ncbi:MAG: agmatinase [Candidatus Aquirickettsiella gammari]|uniref:Agmatinase n=1 Tax=Candidatus Aquirickettsiella gammari TaxID=2016198 RepID=A0A370CHR5_9COXI|nr:MAG: agmatinase [Candidatus Aquirickettsiella gammari]
MRCMPAEKAFLGLDPKDAVTYEDARAVIIPFGLENSVTYGGGTAQGPAAIIRASHEVELFDEHLWCEPFRQLGIVTLEEPSIENEIPKALQQLEKIVKQVLDDQKFPFVLGGEHSITIGAIRPFLKKYDNLILLHFDAHADLRNGYHGEHYSHASAIRRCLDQANLKVVSVGIRNISAEEIPFVEENRERIRIYWGKDKKKWDIDEIVSHLKDLPIYLTFDVDGFDSSVMPATGTPEPGGLFWQDVIEIITAASQVGTIVGADINELAPIPYFHSCDFLVAKLTYKILSLI